MLNLRSATAASVVIIVSEVRVRRKSTRQLFPLLTGLEHNDRRTFGHRIGPDGHICHAHRLWLISYDGFPNALLEYHLQARGGGRS